MANKLARAKGKEVPQVRGGLPCVIFVILLVIFVGVLLFLVMKYAS